MDTIKEELLRKLQQKKNKFTDYKSTDWGKGSEHVSEEVDSILYD